MKKILMIVFVSIVYSASAQTEVGCPPGTSPAISVSLDLFNFHKPRTSCSKGFGLCVKFSVRLICESFSKNVYIKEGKVYTNVAFVNNLAVLHIPISIKNQTGFEKTDMSFFEVEDKAITLMLPNNVEKWVKGGTYPVNIVGDELIVSLPLF